MAHPKRKTSRSRRDKRRSHMRLSLPKHVLCPVTKEVHRPHEAYWFEGKLYYQGQVVLEKTSPDNKTKPEN
ncbi:MAG: 50S ribosomal protein L32 [Cytophagales bacterium]|nr:50S ribosomal protein L32 [Cytophagales bacterium]